MRHCEKNNYLGLVSSEDAYQAEQMPRLSKSIELRPLATH